MSYDVFSKLIMKKIQERKSLIMSDFCSHIFHKERPCEVRKNMEYTIDFWRKNKGQIVDSTSQNLGKNRGQY